MVIHKRGQTAEEVEREQEKARAQAKKQEAMLDYIAALDYPEILPEEEEEEEDGE